MPLTQYIYDVDMIWSDVDSQITPHHATSRICVWGEKPGKTFINQNNCLTRRRARRHRESLRARRPHYRGSFLRSHIAAGCCNRRRFVAESNPHCTTGHGVDAR